MRKKVVIGLVGSTLDGGLNDKRWQRWRPSVAIAMQPDFAIDRFELIYQPTMRDALPLVEVVRGDVQRMSPATDVRLHPIEMRDPWDFAEVYAALDGFAESYPWKATEDYYLHITTGTHVVQICWFLLCETRAIPGVLLQSSPKRQADPRDPKDVVGAIDVIDLQLEKFDRLAARFRARQSAGTSMLKSGIATENAAFNAMIDELELVASKSRDPMLLVGETGTGKTALCERLFELKKLRQHLAGEFVSVNCATLRGDIAMSVLFGHGKGAFTGAAEARTGLLRKAHGGLVFLDEIGELGRDEQAMLLTAIEEKRFYPLGSDKHVTSEFQLVCGTNRDLGGEVRAGRFREDLLARIALWTFRIPALRERPEDLAPNLEYELARISAELGEVISFTKPARDAFLKFAHAAPWHANFRDFNAALRRMATLAPMNRIDAATVAGEIARLTATTTRRDELDAILGARATTLDRFDRVQLADVVAVCRTSPSLSAAGRTLFAHSLAERATKNDADRLRKYLARFDLAFDDLRGDLRDDGKRPV